MQEVLRAAACSLICNHLAHCATHGNRSRSEEEKEDLYDELLDMMYKEPLQEIEFTPDLLSQGAPPVPSGDHLRCEGASCCRR